MRIVKAFFAFMVLCGMILSQSGLGICAQKMKGVVTLLSTEVSQCKGHENLFYEKLCDFVLGSEESRKLIVIEGKTGTNGLDKGQTVILRGKNLGKVKGKVEYLINPEQDLSYDMFKGFNEVVIWHIIDGDYAVIIPDKPVDLHEKDIIRLKVKGKKVQKIEGC